MSATAYRHTHTHTHTECTLFSCTHALCTGQQLRQAHHIDSACPVGIHSGTCLRGCLSSCSVLCACDWCVVLIPCLLHSLFVYSCPFFPSLPSSLSRSSPALAEMVPWVASGKIKYSEHFIDGIENVIPAMDTLWKGDNTGKVMLRVIKNELTDPKSRQ